MDSFTLLIEKELLSDLGSGDVTSKLLFNDEERSGSAKIFSKGNGIFCGEKIFYSFKELFPTLNFHLMTVDSQPIEDDQPVIKIDGTVSTILGLERTFLNFLSHCTGISTLTNRFVELARPTKILSTRKTLPNLRELQLYAVQVGGGHWHRQSLSDGILIKDNHLRWITSLEALRIANENRTSSQSIEIEVQSLKELELVMKDVPDVIMLDNFSLDDLRKAILIIRDKAKIEVSGGVTLENIKEIARLGVDYISVGRLSHSAPSFDFSLEFLT